METLTALSEAERTLALQRFQKLRPHLEDGIALTTVAEETHIYRTV